MPIKLIHTGGPYGDEMSDYIVDFFGEITFEDFISIILTKFPNEYGNIYNKYFDNLIIEYAKGMYQIKDFDTYDNIKDKKIISITSRGGWSLMDYFVKVEGDE